MRNRISGISETSPAIKVIGEQFTKIPQRRVMTSGKTDLEADLQKKQEEQWIASLPKKEMDLLVNDANRIVFGENRRAEFKIHEASGKIIVRLVDLETSEVVREIPPEKIMDMMIHLRELIGLVIDEKV